MPGNDLPSVGGEWNQRETPGKTRLSTPLEVLVSVSSAIVSFKILSHSRGDGILPIRLSFSISRPRKENECSFLSLFFRVFVSINIFRFRFCFITLHLWTNKIIDCNFVLCDRENYILLLRIQRLYLNSNSLVRKEKCLHLKSSLHPSLRAILLCFKGNRGLTKTGKKLTFSRWYFAWRIVARPAIRHLVTSNI